MDVFVDAWIRSDSFNGQVGLYYVNAHQKEILLAISSQ